MKVEWRVCRCDVLSEAQYERVKIGQREDKDECSDSGRRPARFGEDPGGHPYERRVVKGR